MDFSLRTEVAPRPVKPASRVSIECVKHAKEIVLHAKMTQLFAQHAFLQRIFTHWITLVSVIVERACSLMF